MRGPPGRTAAGRAAVVEPATTAGWRNGVATDLCYSHLDQALSEARRRRVEPGDRALSGSFAGSPASPPGAITVGRATDNDIVLPDVLASRHHATLLPTPEGVKIVDARSINGTFVNGTRVDEALLAENDLVTIGNVDLLFQGGTLVRRSETRAATRTGGLQVRAISLTIEHGQELLNNISFGASQAH